MSESPAGGSGGPLVDLPAPPDAAARTNAQGASDAHLWAALPLTLLAWGSAAVLLPGVLWDTTPYPLIAVGCALVGCMFVMLLERLGLARSPRNEESRRRTRRAAVTWMAVLTVLALPAAIPIHRRLPHDYLPRMRADLDATHLRGLVQTGPSDSLQRCVWNVDDTQYAHIDQPFRITDGTDPKVAAEHLEDHFRALGYSGTQGLRVWTYEARSGIVGVRLEASRCTFFGDQ